MHRHAFAIALARRRVRRIAVVVVNRQRRHEPRSLADHLRDIRIGEVEPMLDRVATAIERALHSFTAVCMTRHLSLPSMRLVDDRLQLIDGERRL